MAEENVLPFCSRATFSETGVLELKNFSQFAVISAAAAELPEAAGADERGRERAPMTRAPRTKALTSWTMSWNCCRRPPRVRAPGRAPEPG